MLRVMLPVMILRITRALGLERIGLPAALASVVMLASGCAAVPWPPLSRIEARAPALPAGEAGLLDLRGAVHVHTRGSHDSPGTLEGLLAGARSAGLAWVALTEHTRPGVILGHGRLGDVTVLPGFEVRARGGSLLLIGVAERPPRFADPAEAVRWAHAAGGVAFVGHFEKSGLRDPELYRRVAPDGIEIVNLHAQANRTRLGLALRLTFLPARVALRGLLRTPEENLARWAALPGARAIVGGVDAHNKFRLLGPLGGTLDRYGDMFRMLTTHVWARDAEPASILEALRAGRSYVALEGLGRVDAFRFERRAARGGFHLAAPRIARLALICDGREVASQQAASATLESPAGARWCRGEVWLGDRLWVITSYREAA